MEVLPSRSTAIVKWKQPLATDNSGRDVSVTCNKNSSSRFEIGETDVVCEARDWEGKASYCSFTVAVKGSEAPRFTSCPANQSLNTSSGEPFAVDIWEQPKATDNSGIPPNITCNADSNSQFEIGMTQLSCMARDAVGNYAFVILPLTYQILRHHNLLVRSTNLGTLNLENLSLSYLGTKLKRLTTPAKCLMLIVPMTQDLCLTLDAR
ncbi:hyalin-like [Amphiura filiformis]|uniref:hyalin-like n=1 Tax=Amphiura filiformis TaxID=82378 RepID=UPI003B22113A